MNRKGSEKHNSVRGRYKLKVNCKIHSYLISKESLHSRLSTTHICSQVMLIMLQVFSFGIISVKRDLTHVLFKISNYLIFYKSEMSTTHCFLRTENRSICHGVVRLLMFC